MKSGEGGGQRGLPDSSEGLKIANEVLGKSLRGPRPVFDASQTGVFLLITPSPPLCTLPALLENLFTCGLPPLHLRCGRIPPLF